MSMTMEECLKSPGMAVHHESGMQGILTGELYSGGSHPMTVVIMQGGNEYGAYPSLLTPLKKHA